MRTPFWVESALQLSVSEGNIGGMIYVVLLFRAVVSFRLLVKTAHLQRLIYSWSKCRLLPCGLSRRLVVPTVLILAGLRSLALWTRVPLCRKRVFWF
jgi:hypothetical protein